jgi:methyl-accepting chemotaxis protein
MFALLKRSAPPAIAEGPGRNADAAPSVEAMQAAIRSIAQQASGMGKEAAEVRGVLDDTTKASKRGAQAVAELARQASEINRSQDAIAEVANASLGSVERARAAVQEVGNGVAGIVATLRQVSQAAATITQIAMQTRLVAFNASVEAKRAGDAGRGFGVVADAVKDLAAKVESSSKEIMGTVGELNERIDSLSREIQLDAEGQAGGGAAPQGAFHKALGEMEHAVARITAAAGSSRTICAALDARMDEVALDMKNTGAALDHALSRSESFLRVSEQLIELVAESGIESEDTPFIALARQAAAQISTLLEDALRTRSISERDLFDEDYRPIPNTEPAQHLTRFVELADRLFPQVQEKVLSMHEKIVFCIAVDRNGYVATHNQKYCLPQRGNLAWDTANSRYRRIFNDRTGLASARNRRPFLLQTYRRDMGGGQFVLMKEAAAPIVVAGKHWGGLRLAFKF